GTRPISINFRLVAATNRSMAQAVRQGLFRADLYYRTAVITLRVPPLRERREDILPLARYFLHHFARRHQTDCVEDFSEENRRLLEQWSWPGNVRELRNAVEQSVILSGGRRITLSDDPFADSFEAGEPDISRSGPPPDADSAAGNAFLNLPADLSLEEMERRYILAVLHRTNWRIDGPHGALRILKISRSALYAKIRRYGLRRENGSE
ncbi:MAG: sigma 54-interacting transcriptional regulator, partial [Desulfovibrionaceae bacterium]|nr:sigma 54-interacting transcriptional regulator [Desulfovibrionaceae bacterium]